MYLGVPVDSRVRHYVANPRGFMGVLVSLFFPLSTSVKVSCSTERCSHDRRP